MCTVTFLPSDGDIFIASNRDEKPTRAAAEPPKVYSSNFGKLLYPKDAEAGGTWFAIHETGSAVVLLNGATKAHEPAPPYRKSRGLVLFDIVERGSPLDSFRRISFANIEPFTAVLFQDGHLFVGRWDGTQKNIQQLNAGESHIWSSATLYNPQATAKRENWFDEWRAENKLINEESVMAFHRFNGGDDPHNGITMNRESVSTMSITIARISAGGAAMQYTDCRTNATTTANISFIKAMAFR